MIICFVSKETISTYLKAKNSLHATQIYRLLREKKTDAKLYILILLAFIVHLHTRIKCFTRNWLALQTLLLYITSFIQYCDSNIGLFSTAPHLVIALPTL